MVKEKIYAKLGAIAYIIWGILHIQVSRLVFSLGGTLEPGIIQGRVNQDAFNLMFFALFAITIAIWMNWKNSRLGYWLNLVVISAADIGFIVYVLLPGYAPINPGIFGPILWLIAIIFSTLGIKNKKNKTF